MITWIALFLEISSINFLSVCHITEHTLHMEAVDSMFQAIFLGGPDSLPYFLSRFEIPGLDVVVDPCAAILVLVVTALLCIGIKEVLVVLHKVSIFAWRLRFIELWELSNAEFICAIRHHSRQCLCHAVCHNSWWIYWLSNWLGWIFCV